MSEKSLITVDYVRSILDYDPETGIFIWKVRPLNHFKNKRSCAVWNARYSNKIAGKLAKNGYISISINNVSYYAHRLAWLFINNSHAKENIDHINMKKTDNRIKNLRIATIDENNRNTRSKRKSHLPKGVYKIKDKKYISSITFNSKQKHLGTFNCPAAASFAYQIASDIHFGEFARAF